MRFLLSKVVVMVIGGSPSILEDAKGPDLAQAFTIETPQRGPKSSAPPHITRGQSGGFCAAPHLYNAPMVSKIIMPQPNNHSTTQGSPKTRTLCGLHHNKFLT